MAVACSSGLANNGRLTCSTVESSVKQRRTTLAALHTTLQRHMPLHLVNLIECQERGIYQHPFPGEGVLHLPDRYVKYE